MPTTPDRSALIDQLRDALDDMGWQNLRYAERLLAPYGLTFPQAIVLALLETDGPEIEMSHIATRTSLPASTITSIMDRLVARGYATRHPSSTDRRRITGSASAEGRTVLQELESTRRETLDRLVADFSDEELGLLSRLIDRWTAISDDLTGDDS